jgi:hypothetical protein
MGSAGIIGLNFMVKPILVLLITHNSADPRDLSIVHKCFYYHDRRLVGKDGFAVVNIWYALLLLSY